MLQKFATALAAFAITAVPAIVLAQANTGQTVVASQTVLTGTLEQPINTKSVQQTDPFILDVQPPYPADDQRFNGARVYGHIASVTRASGTTKGGVTLAFDRLEMPDGTEASLAGQLLSTQGQAGGNTAGRAIVGGVLGQIVGNYIGKHIGTNIGGAVGAIGGAVYAGSLGTNVTLPQGSTVQFKTTQAALVTGRRQAPDRQYENGRNENNGQPYGPNGQPPNLPPPPNNGPAPSYSSPYPQPSPTI